MSYKILPVNSKKDIPRKYRSTAIASLLEYHNLNRSLTPHLKAKLLVGMCMDNRKRLRLPNNFAYILRTGGANLRYSEFKIAYAIGIAGIQCMALIAHNHCGMVDLASKKKKFIQGMTKHGGWTSRRATEHFLKMAPLFEIEDAAEFVLSEAARLSRRFPGIKVAPLYYKIEDNRLYCLA